MTAFLAALLVLAPLIGVGVNATRLGYDYSWRHPYGWREVRPQSPEWYALCQNTYRTFDPSTGTYRGLDGKWHPCRFGYVRGK